jgi:transcriptional regulator with XRE-family HTH domain
LGVVFGEEPKDPIRVPNALVLFGRQLRELRLSRDLSQERLAELCGYETNQIGRIERAERTVSFEGIMRISFGLSMPPAELFKLIPAAKRLPRKGQYSGEKNSGTKKVQR